MFIFILVFGYEVISYIMKTNHIWSIQGDVMNHSKNIERNEKLIQEFCESMKAEGLKSSTINKHSQNIELYINDFLTYYQEKTAEEGWNNVDDYLGDWFINKVMWSTPNSVKENITSIKKFYKYLYETGKISKANYDELLTVIKSEKDIWVEVANMDEDDLYGDDYSYDVLDEALIDSKNKMYRLLDDLIKKKPWEKFSDKDIFCIVVDEIPYFVIVLGNAGKLFGFLAYESIEGFYLYMDILNDNVRHPSQLMFHKYGYEVDLDDEMNFMDHRTCDVIFDKLWPVVSYYVPGLFPEELELNQVNKLSRILEVLNAHFEDMSSLEVDLMDKQLIQVLSIEGENLKRDVVHMDDLIRKYEKPYELQFKENEIEIKKIQKMKFKSMTWEMDTFFLPNPIEKEYFPKITVIIDRGEELIIGQSMAHKDEAAEVLVKDLISAIQEKGKPSRVILSKDKYDPMLQAVLELFKIPVEFGNQIMLEDFKSDFLDYSFIRKYGGDAPFDVEPIPLREMLSNLRKKELFGISENLGLDIKKSNKKDVFINSIYNNLTDETVIFTLISLLKLNEYVLFLSVMAGNHLFEADTIIDARYLLNCGVMSIEIVEDKAKYTVPSEIIEIFNKIDSTQIENTVRELDLISEFTDACMNLYGLISLSDYREVMTKILPFMLPKDNVDEYIFDRLTKILKRQRHYGLVDNYIMHEVFLTELEDPEKIIKQDKPLYIPSFEEFMRYSDDFYTEETNELTALNNYFVKEFDIDAEYLEDIIFEIKDNASEMDLNGVFNMLEYYDIKFNSEKQIERFMKVYTKFINNSRTWFNRGNTPQELSGNVAKKDVKVGRNEPCPCGSGKKYKKCCGK